MTLVACFKCNALHEQGQRCPEAQPWGGRMVQVTRKRIAHRDGHACQECGKPTPMNEGHVDHIVTRAMGGPNTDRNLRWTCEDCNLRKGNA